MDIIHLILQVILVVTSVAMVSLIVLYFVEMLLATMRVNILMEYTISAMVLISLAYLYIFKLN